MGRKDMEREGGEGAGILALQVSQSPSENRPQRF